MSEYVRCFGRFACVAATCLLSAPPAHAQSCAADLSGDLAVDATDLAALLAAWGPCPTGSSCGPDISGDGRVDGIDLSSLLASWGQCPVTVPAWATLIEARPTASLVPASGHRAAIAATGYAWRIRDNATQIEMVLIPAGTFPMGCQPAGALICPNAELPVHLTTLTGAFYMGRFEVTQAQWSALMGSNPSVFQGPGYPQSADHPVEMVSWSMAQEFVQKAGLRLPTEAEWEHACRAGTIPAYHGFPGLWGGSGADFHLTEIGWYAGNSTAQTHPVGLKAPNGFALHDMSGNVLEWVNDWYAPTYFSSTAITDPAGPISGTTRVLRSGSWAAPAGQCRSASRTHADPGSPALVGSSTVGFGFRVVRSP